MWSCNQVRNVNVLPSISVENSMEYNISSELKDSIFSHLTESQQYILIFDVTEANEFSVLLMNWEFTSPPTRCDSIVIASNRYVTLNKRRIPVVPYEDFLFSNYAIKLMEHNAVSVGCRIVGGGYLILASGPPLSSKVHSIRLVN